MHSNPPARVRCGEGRVRAVGAGGGWLEPGCMRTIARPAECGYDFEPGRVAYDDIPGCMVGTISNPAVCARFSKPGRVGVYEFERGCVCVCEFEPGRILVWWGELQVRSSLRALPCVRVSDRRYRVPGGMLKI